MAPLTEFSDRVKKLNDIIKSHYAKFGDGEKKIISDGIVNLHEYFKAEPKILWILKEPYDKAGEGAGGWSVTDLLNNENELQKKLGGLKTTWHPIIYASYAIHNDFKEKEHCDDIEDNPEMLKVLKKIAFINVQKFAANTTTNDNDIMNAYNEHKRILLEQVNTYNPDIIVGGNTLKYFLDDLGLKHDDGHYDEVVYWIKANKLYINASHPAVRGSLEVKEEYVDNIVRIAKRFCENHLNKK